MCVFASKMLEMQRCMVSCLNKRCIREWSILSKCSSFCLRAGLSAAFCIKSVSQFSAILGGR